MRPAGYTALVVLGEAAGAHPWFHVKYEHIAFVLADRLAVSQCSGTRDLLRVSSFRAAEPREQKRCLDEALS